MNNSKIAIITDSSCDIPKEYLEKHQVFILPLHVSMPEGDYLDGVNISPQEVYSRMPEVVPSTSQPSPGDIKELFEQLKREGYQEAIAVCISSGLSGTFNVFGMCAKEEYDLHIHMFDSRRLSMALGLLVIQAVDMNEAGSSSAEILAALEDSWANTNGYFCIPTLHYLIKGGRIGLVTGTLGTILGIVPVISINQDGRYFTYAKCRNYSCAIKKIEESIRKIAADKRIDIAVLYGNAAEKAKIVHANLKNLKGLRNLYLCQISPALGVHTGPGLVGLAYRIIK